MTITAIQVTGNAAATSASVSQAFVSNVTAGNLIVIVGMRYNNLADPYVEADCTQSAGTATLGTIALHLQTEVSLGGNNHDVGIWSVPVTGTGSCTMQIAGGNVGNFPDIGIGEFSASGGWSSTAATRLEDTNNGNNTTGAPSSGDGTSAGEALFIGALAVDTGGSVTITEDGAFTVIYEQEAGASFETGSAIYQIVSSGTTDAASWSAPTTLPWSAILCVLKPEAGGGGGGGAIARITMPPMIPGGWGRR